MLSIVRFNPLQSVAGIHGDSGRKGGQIFGDFPEFPGGGRRATTAQHILVRPVFCSIWSAARRGGLKPLDGIEHRDALLTSHPSPAGVWASRPPRW